MNSIAWFYSNFTRFIGDFEIIPQPALVSFRTLVSCLNVSPVYDHLLNLDLYLSEHQLFFFFLKAYCQVFKFY